MPFEFSEKASSAVANSATERSRPSVLIVEDDPAMRKLLERELARQGFETFLVSSAAEARQAMEAIVFPIAIVDRVLEDADGIDLIAELRRRYAHHRIFIVLFSSLDSAEEQRLGMGAGADAYVSKSAFPETLVEQLARGVEVVRLNKR